MMISVRRYRHGEEARLHELFYHTIRTINARDYTEDQVRAWAPDEVNLDAWRRDIRARNPFVAILDGVIAGFADIQNDGLIDLFFCDAAFQGQGVGTALMTAIFEEGDKLGVRRYYSHVSITARPFFERMGFVVVEAKQVAVRGVTMDNFLMEKCRE